MVERRPGARFERFLLWALFILPAVCGCVIWIKGIEPIGFAYVSWMFSAAFAVLLMLEYHMPPRDR